MDFSFSEEQSILLNSAKSFLEKEAKNIILDVEKTDEGYSLDLWQKMAGLGWMGVNFPEEYGGNGGDFFDLILLLEEMGKTLVLGPFIPTVICSGLAILHHGSELQKKEFLPKLTSGKLLMIPALVSPNSTRGELEIKEQVDIRDGNYLLSGTRLFVSYGHLADWFIYGNETNEGKTLFLIDAKSPGVNIALLRTIAPDRKCKVILDKVRVPKANILGKAGEGEEIMKKINEWGSISQCGYILGLLEQVLRMSVDYAKKRVQFEKPIGSFQAIQHQCADMATEIDKVKFLTYQAAWKLAENLSATREISMAKARASDISRNICLLGIKIHGGIGLSEEYVLQLYFRMAKAAELSFGDADFHREILAQQLGL